MLNARELALPARPAVSPECRDFLIKCLAYRREDRMDVHAAAAHPFVADLGRRERRGSGAGAGGAH
jgi:tousled-like kinase